MSFCCWRGRVFSKAGELEDEHVQLKTESDNALKSISRLGQSWDDAGRRENVWWKADDASLPNVGTPVAPTLTFGYRADGLVTSVTENLSTGPQWLRRRLYRAAQLSEFRPDKFGHLSQFPNMSKAEILDEIPKLTPAERDEIRGRLDELDDALSPEELALVDARMEEHRRNPASALPIKQIKADLRARVAH